MPDLLSHVLLAYTLSTILTWRFSWITPPYRTVCMVGALVPDMYKIYLLVPENTIESLIGLPFDWFALRTGGGVLVAVLVGGLFVDSRERVRVLAMLGVGAASHLIADLFLRTPSGETYPIFWPITSYRPHTPNLYLSTDPAVTVMFALFALTIYYVTWRRE